MLSISTPLTNPEYLLQTARLNYYQEGGEPLGRWSGGGAQALGLSGAVEPEALRNLFRGYSADGSTPLVQNPGAPDRQCAWDLTFSADKSVSTMWAVASPEVRSQIEEAHGAAVRRALEFLESEAGFTRRGKGSRRIEEALLVFALFRHGTSRENDPQLHDHCLLLNISVRSDGTTGSILTKPIFRLKMIAGLIYRQALGHELKKRLGVELRAEKTWLAVEGIPPEVCDHFSRRRKQVLSQLKSMGRSDAVSAAMATKATRKGKEMVPRPQLFDDWARQAREGFGFTAEFIASLIQPYRPSRQPLGLQAAVDTLLQETSYFTERHFLRRVLERNQATGHSVDRILKGVSRSLRNLVDLGIHNGERLYTTRAVLQEEQVLLEKAVEGRDRKDHVVPLSRARRMSQKLSETQKEAFLHITTEPGDLKCIQGWAGTGKSSLLAAARELWQAAGFQILGAAYSGKAADSLTQSSGIPSHTIDRLLHQWSKDLSAIKPLDRKSILVVDEAGMLDTLKLSRLLGIVKRAGAKLVLVGDEKQLPPIAAGAPFPELGRRLGRGELTEIRRQRNGLLKVVVEDLAQGNVRHALGLLRHDKLIQLHETADAARQSLVQDWFKHRTTGDTVMLAGTREDVRDLNLRAQSLNAASHRDPDPVFEMNGIRFRIGDRILFGKNDALLGVRNGSLGELTAFNPLSRSATIRLDGGKSVYIPVNSYKSLDLGYCLTTHKAQGATVDKAFVLWSDTLQSREMTYVQASRARLLTRFYLTREQAGPDFGDAIKDMERSVAKDLAVSKAREAGVIHQRPQDLSPSL